MLKVRFVEGMKINEKELFFGKEIIRKSGQILFVFYDQQTTAQAIELRECEDDLYELVAVEVKKDDYDNVLSTTVIENPKWILEAFETFFMFHSEDIEYCEPTSLCQFTAFIIKECQYDYLSVTCDALDTFINLEFSHMINITFNVNMATDTLVLNECTIKNWHSEKNMGNMDVIISYTGCLDSEEEISSFFESKSINQFKQDILTRMITNELIEKIEEQIA